MHLRHFAPISAASDFSLTYTTAKKWHCECAVVHFLPSNKARFAAVASKKIGKATERNRAKRLLRSAFLATDPKDGMIVLVAKGKILEMSFDKIKRNLRWAFSKIGALK